MKFCSSMVVALVLLTSAASTQERLRVCPGLTSDRLEVRDPQGRIIMTVERSLTGRLIIKRLDGTVIGSVIEPKEEKAPQRRSGSYLSLPASWGKE
jgi:hypothetical protein